MACQARAINADDDITASENRMPARRFLGKFFNVSTRSAIWSRSTFDQAKLQRLAALYDEVCKTRKPTISKFMNRPDVLQIFNQPCWPAKKQQVSKDMVVILK